jgi:flagellar hook-basal body complex protein FliE
MQNVTGMETAGVNALRREAPARLERSSLESGSDASFAALLKSGIDHVNAQQQQATALASGFEAGQDGVDLAEVMLASQKAGLAFRALTQIRNQVVSAYQDVMRMTI